MNVRRSAAARSLLALCAAVVVLAAVSCGGQPPAGTQRLRIVVPTTAMSWLLPTVAAHDGAFRRHGIDARVTVAGSGPLDIQAVTGGGADVGLNVLNLVQQADVQGRNLVAFGRVFRQWQGQLVVSKAADRAHHVTRQSDQDGRLRAVKGLTIAVVGPGTGDDLLLRSLLSRAGLRPDQDVKITPIKDQQSMVAALSQGRIDGFLRASPGPELALYKGIAVTVTNLTSTDTKGLFAGALVAQHDWLKQHAALARNLVAALDDAGADLAGHPDQAAGYLRTGFAGLPRAVFDQAYTSARTVSDHPVARVSDQDFQTNLRFVKPTSGADNLEFDRVVDNSLL